MALWLAKIGELKRKMECYALKRSVNFEENQKISGYVVTQPIGLL